MAGRDVCPNVTNEGSWGIASKYYANCRSNIYNLSETIQRESVTLSSINANQSYVLWTSPTMVAGELYSVSATVLVARTDYADAAFYHVRGGVLCRTLSNYTKYAANKKQLPDFSVATKRAKNLPYPFVNYYYNDATTVLVLKGMSNQNTYNAIAIIDWMKLP